MPNFLITGSSRGIGLGLVTELLKDSTASTGLQDLVAKYPKERLITLTLDVTLPSEVAQASKEAAKVFPDGIDYFIHNAGCAEQLFALVEELDLAMFEKEISFYTISVIHILREFKPLVLKSVEKKFIFISSVTASLTLVPSIGGDICIPYSIGKAALNMLVRKWGIVNQEQGITVAMIHPGLVDTDIVHETVSYYLAKGLVPIPVEESVDGIIKVALEVELKDTASFWSYTGEIVPW
ncbi:NAD(P)-binding protein [Panus rudis PR-1116 ss-1]|nr:NAD(P)-binding protein [Panus rudis PR-1116 ss-1]